MSEQPAGEWEFPRDGILWRKWGKEAVDEILAKDRPVLLFVADRDPLLFPFLREIFRSLPKNEKLRQILHKEIIGLFLEADAVPENELGLYGAGKNYHLAILSPSGFTPMVTFPFHVCTPSEVVEQIVVALERLLETW